MTRPRPIHARWRSTPRRTLAGAALVLVAGLVGGAQLVSAGPAEPERGITIGDPPQRLQSPQPRPQPGTATVTLITGDQVRVDTAANGHQETSQVNAETDTVHGPAVQFSWGGDQYVVPGEAVPYLGAVLDPALFNVSYLVRAGLHDAGTDALPVSIKQAGGRAADLPGVRVAGVTGETAAATVAKAEAGQLGARLGQAWRASRAGTAATPIGTLPGIDRITLAAPAGVESPPQLPLGQPVTSTERNTRYRTVTIDPIDRDGRPGVAVGFLHNVEDPRAFGTLFVAAAAGPLSFSVPEGVYSAEVSVLNGPVDDYFRTTGSLVVEPEIAVTGDRTITLDARRAVPYRPNVDPAVQPGRRTDRLIATRVNEAREGATTNDAIVSLGMRLFSIPEFGGPTLYVTPTAPVSRGHLELLGQTTFADAVTTNPSYLFAYRWDRAIPATLTPPVSRAELTPVRSQLYRDPSGQMPDTVQLSAGIWTPVTRTAVLNADYVPYGERVDYWYTNAPDSVWFQSQGIDSRRIRPGEEIQRIWNKAPVVPPPTAYSLLPGGNVHPRDGADPDLTGCVACRQDDNGLFFVLPSSLDPSGFDFYRNGTLALTSRNAAPGTFMLNDLVLPMLPEPADYRLEWELARANDPQARVRTGWTFRSSRTDPAADVVCAPDSERPCSFLPLLFPRYDLPIDFDGRAPAGAPFELAFHVEHQQHQPAPTGVTATVSVSYDGGTTWSQPIAAADRGDGRFTASVTHPPLAETDGFVALRVQARDGAGNAVDQTITRAYGLTG